MTNELRRRNVQKVEPAPSTATLQNSTSKTSNIQKSDSFINRCLAKVSNTVMHGIFSTRQTRMKLYKLETNYGFEEFRVPTSVANFIVFFVAYYVVTPFIKFLLKKSYDSLIKEI